MSRQFTFIGLGLFSVVLALDWAQADQVFPSNANNGLSISCRVGETSVSCTRFEGYIFVRRGDAAPDSSPHNARSEATLGGQRIYLPVGADKSP